MPWTQCDQLDEEVRVGCLVCGSLFVPVGSENLIHHLEKGLCA